VDSEESIKKKMKKEDARVIVKPHPFSKGEIEERFAKYKDNFLMKEIGEVLKNYAIGEEELSQKKVVRAEQFSKQKEKNKTVKLNVEYIKKDKTEFFEKKLATISHLLTLPDHVLKIREMLDSHRASVQNIADEISKDPVLVAEILRIANSGFYGFTHRIADIQQAIVMLGFAVIHAIVISASVINLREAKKLWEHSVACARVTVIIACQMKLHHQEELAICGLLHDVGRLALMEYFKEDYAKIVQLAFTENLVGFEAEKTLLGLTHSEIGGWLLKKWNLPPALVETTLFHHQPEKSVRFQERAAVVSLADFLVNAMGISVIDNFVIPELRQEILTFLKIQGKDVQDVIENFINATDD
jgi:HD-like signal output (HDOD) protein